VGRHRLPALLESFLITMQLRYHHVDLLLLDFIPQEGCLNSLVPLELTRVLAHHPVRRVLRILIRLVIHHPVQTVV
jgi:hypothetical protein